MDTTGNWDLVSDPSNANQSNSSVVNFNATINMKGTDNSDGHEHKISEFKLIDTPSEAVRKVQKLPITELEL